MSCKARPVCGVSQVAVPSIPVAKDSRPLACFACLAPIFYHHSRCHPPDLAARDGVSAPRRRACGAANAADGVCGSDRAPARWHRRNMVYGEPKRCPSEVEPNRMLPIGSMPFPTRQECFARLRSARQDAQVLQVRPRSFGHVHPRPLCSDGGAVRTCWKDDVFVEVRYHGGVVALGGAGQTSQRSQVDGYSNPVVPRLQIAQRQAAVHDLEVAF